MRVRSAGGESMKSDMHSVMLDHIAEEPGLILGLLEHRQAVTADFCRIFLENNIKRVYFSGSGFPIPSYGVRRQTLRSSLMRFKVFLSEDCQ